MEDKMNNQQGDALDKERRKVLQKLGALGLAAATAPAMMTLLQATRASAQSGRGKGG